MNFASHHDSLKSFICLHETKTGSDNGMYCHSWYCYEYTLINNHPEHENYYCTEESSDGKYCTKWDGLIDGEEEFEFSKCECTTIGCSKWNCQEKGMNYFFPNLFWSLLCIIFGLPPTYLIYAGIFNKDVPIIFGLVTYVIWTGGWTILCVWLGGLNVLVITLAVHFGPLFLFFASVVVAKGCTFDCDCPSSSSSSFKPKMPTYNYDTNSRDVEMMQTDINSLPVATATQVVG